MIAPDNLERRTEQYLLRRGITQTGQLGGGKDGTVWRTSRLTALKVHQRLESYLIERNAYIRFRDRQIRSVAGLTIPAMLEYDDALGAIEMEVVFPPFIVDFSSARFDAPDLIEDEGHTLIDLIRGRFEDRVDEVIAIHAELAARAGIYLLDLHPHNIKFA